MDRIFSTESLHAIEQQYGVPLWFLLILAVVMFGSWTACYIAIITKCFRDKTYGLPLLDICLNFSWELMFSFKLSILLPISIEWGNRSWFLFDIANVAQIYLYGRNAQHIGWVKKHFYVISTAMLILSYGGLYTFTLYVNDMLGVLSAFMIDLLMSAMFISMFFNRQPELRGLSYPGAWFKLFGNLGGCCFCHYWWPAQFHGNTLDVTFQGVEYKITEPISYLFLNLLYVIIPVLDMIYIYLLWDHRRQEKMLTR